MSPADNLTSVGGALHSPAVQVVIAVVAVVLVVVVGRELLRVPARLHVLMFTAFLDMVGALIVIPLLPFYAARMGAGGLIVGILVSSFAAAQLLSAPLWGRFSDRFGRRPTLLVALGASVIAYIIFGYATSIWVLLLSRLVLGAGGGTVGVIQAYVADATEPRDRARSLGWLSAATNAGVALGPVLGSWAALVGSRTFTVGSGSFSIGHAAPGLLAASLCLLNMGFAWKYLQEPKGVTGEHPVHKHEPRATSTAGAALRVISHSAEPSSRLIWIYAIAMGAFGGATAVLGLFLKDEFGVTEETIGYFFLYIGVISVITRVLALGRLVDRLGEPRLSRVGMVLLALGLGGLPFASNLALMALFVALIPLGTAFTFPCVTAMLSRVIHPGERGLYMGLQQTFGGTARVVFPIAMGTLFDTVGHGWPFWVCGALVLSTISLGLGMEGYLKPKPAAAAPSEPATAA
ncbi:MAG: MFS transporter [Gemmatimonadetes bacterium]|nr:MFS transporter [Gemmatimonadota bacterium]